MKIKILSWNIWYHGYFDQITKFLKESDADIIGLQEVVVGDKDRDIIGYLSALGYNHVFAPVMKIEDGRTMSNAIFSKFKITGSETIDLSEKDYRNALRADIEVGGKTLHVFSTHLLHTHQKPSEIQDLQAKNLLKSLPSENTIVMGDFNTTPESEAIRIIEEVLVKADSKLDPTAFFYEAGCNEGICKLTKGHLDYIFLSKNLKSHSFEIGDSKGSDHLPISTVIEV